MTAGPLAGVRVIEVGHVLAGPFAGMLLADLGADVIKVEAADGDLSRQVGSQYVDGHNVYFASINRNKRSVHIDLTTAEGQDQLRELARTAHALLVNMRPSTIRKFGLDYDSLKHLNPKLVCVALTGYGMHGSASEWPAFDYVIQAITGVANLTGEPDGPPTLAGYSAVDNSAAIMAALALVAKVHEGEVWLDRAATGKLLVEISRRSASRAAVDPAQERIAALTVREREIIALTAANVGETGKAIAERLHISEHTLRNHLTSIYEKLGVANRLELFAFAHDHKLAKARF